MEMTKYMEQRNNLIANNKLLKLAVVMIGLGLVVNAGHGINYVNIAEVRTLPHLHGTDAFFAARLRKIA